MAKSKSDMTGLLIGAAIIGAAVALTSSKDDVIPPTCSVENSTKCVGNKLYVCEQGKYKYLNTCSNCYNHPLHGGLCVDFTNLKKRCDPANPNK